MVEFGVCSQKYEAKGLELELRPGVLFCIDSPIISTHSKPLTTF